jgi:hypothetical protein
MSDVVYVSKSRIERKKGPLRIAHVAGEPQPVVFSVHGAIAEHYKVDPLTLTESHASTLDYVIASTAGPTDTAQTLEAVNANAIPSVMDLTDPSGGYS